MMNLIHFLRKGGITMTNQLKSCPFCGQYALTIRPHGVRCEECVYDGPSPAYGDEDEAVKLWNSRYNDDD